MARKIIILERVDEPSDLNFNYVFWADVPAARNVYYADADKTSAVKDVTGAELAAIRSGAVLEHRGKATYSAGTLPAQVRADLVSQFNRLQNVVTGRNPYIYYGTYYDGTAWVAGGVA